MYVIHWYFQVPLQLVDHGPGGPIRSRRGRGYINPFVQFTDGGRCFLDRLDGFTNEGILSYCILV